MGLIPVYSKFQLLFGARPIRLMICRVSGPGTSSEWAVEWMVQNIYIIAFAKNVYKKALIAWET